MCVFVCLDEKVSVNANLYTLRQVPVIVWERKKNQKKNSRKDASFIKALCVESPHTKAQKSSHKATVGVTTHHISLVEHIIKCFINVVVIQENERSAGSHSELHLLTKEYRKEKAGMTKLVYKNAQKK